MSPAQKATLGFLAVLVLVALVAAVVAATSREDGEGAHPRLTTTTGVLTATTATTSTTRPPPASGPVTATTTSSSTTTTVATTTTATTAAGTAALVLRPDGIGSVYFGTDASAALATLVEVLGDPDEDTDWVDQRENYGICLGEEVRFVRWGSLQVFFTDGPSDWRPAGVRHFASYTQTTYFDGEELALVTSDGLALGSPVGDLRARYGEEAVLDDPLYGPVFLFDPPGAAVQWGSLSGLAADDTIESITGSYACGE